MRPSATAAPKMTRRYRRGDRLMREGQPLTFNIAVASNGVFTLPAALLAQLADGTLALSAQQTDAAGNVSAVASATVVLDRVGDAVVTGLAASDGA